MPGGAGSLPRPVAQLQGSQPALEVGDPGPLVQPGLLAVPGPDHGQLHHARGEVTPGRVHLRPRAPQGALDLELCPGVGQPGQLPSQPFTVELQLHAPVFKSQVVSAWGSAGPVLQVVPR